MRQELQLPLNGEWLAKAIAMLPSSEQFKDTEIEQGIQGNQGTMPTGKHCIVLRAAAVRLCRGDEGSAGRFENGPEAVRHGRTSELANFQGVPMAPSVEIAAAVLLPYIQPSPGEAAISR